MGLPTLDQWLTFLALKSIGQLFFGRGFNMDYVSPGLAAEILLGIGVLLVLLNRRQPAWLWPTVVFAAFGGIELLGSAARFLKNPLGFRPIENASRYFFLPRLLLIWCLLPHLRVHVGWRRWSLWALLALAALAAAADLSCRGLPDGRWAEQAAAFERGEKDTLSNYPNWRIFLERPAMRGDRDADALGATPLRIIPPENAARVSIGAESFLQLRAAKGGLVYETPPRSGPSRGTMPPRPVGNAPSGSASGICLRTGAGRSCSGAASSIRSTSRQTGARTTSRPPFPRKPSAGSS